MHIPMVCYSFGLFEKNSFRYPLMIYILTKIQTLRNTTSYLQLAGAIFVILAK